MKTILIAIFFSASSAAYAQKSCDDLKGLEKEACLKQGGTVKANYTKHDDRTRNAGKKSRWMPSLC